MCVESLVTVFVPTYHTERCWCSFNLQRSTAWAFFVWFQPLFCPQDARWQILDPVFPFSLRPCIGQQEKLQGRFFSDFFCEPIRRLSCSLDLISSIRKQSKVGVDVDSASSTYSIVATYNRSQIITWRSDMTSISLLNGLWEQTLYFSGKRGNKAREMQMSESISDHAFIILSLFFSRVSFSRFEGKSHLRFTFPHSRPKLSFSNEARGRKVGLQRPISPFPIIICLILLSMAYHGVKNDCSIFPNLSLISTVFPGWHISPLSFPQFALFERYAILVLFMRRPLASANHISTRNYHFSPFKKSLARRMDALWANHYFHTCKNDARMKLWEGKNGKTFKNGCIEQWSEGKERFFGKCFSSAQCFDAHVDSLQALFLFAEGYSFSLLWVLRDPFSKIGDDETAKIIQRRANEHTNASQIFQSSGRAAVYDSLDLGRRLRQNMSLHQMKLLPICVPHPLHTHWRLPQDIYPFYVNFHDFHNNARCF